MVRSNKFYFELLCTNPFYPGGLWKDMHIIIVGVKWVKKLGSGSNNRLIKQTAHNMGNYRKVGKPLDLKKKIIAVACKTMLPRAWT